MAYKQPGANIPNKVLQVNVTTITNDNQWPFDDGKGDPWWSGGSTPVPYRWIMELTVSTQDHSSHLTREPFEYNGLDIYVDDWITNTGSAVALNVISVLEKTETTATILVEDIDRYNTYKDPNQNGLGRFTPGTAIIFQISNEGMPLIDPLPPTVTQVDFAPQLNARFRNFDKEQRFKLGKIAHNFDIGDVIAMEAGDIVLADGNVNQKPFGTVIETGPGPNQFYFRPFTKVEEFFQPNLPGTPGDYLYSKSGGSGDLSTIENGTPLMMVITEAVPSTVVGIENPSLTNGDQFNLNNVLITTDGTLAQLVIDINATTGTHGVTAQEVLSDTIAETVIADTAFSLVAGGVPFSATINGILVNFSTTTSGGTFADEVDIAFDINAASIPNLVASSGSSKVFLTETASGSITIINGTNDTFGNPFAGPSSVTGLPLSTPASTDTALELTHPNGLEILLENVTNTPVQDLGLISTWNGRVPAGVVVDQGIRIGNMYVVANIAARDAINALIGDQTYVINTGEGEFAIYLFDGSVWVQLGDQDSSNVDATTESITITSADSFPALIHRVSDGSRVVNVNVEVTIAFDGSPIINVGDTTVNDRLMPDAFIDLSTIGSYSNTPSHQYDTGGLETEIFVFLSSPGTVGEAIITITYA